MYYSCEAWLYIDHLFLLAVKCGIWWREKCNCVDIKNCVSIPIIGTLFSRCYLGVLQSNNDTN